MVPISELNAEQSISSISFDLGKLDKLSFF